MRIDDLLEQEATFTRFKITKSQFIDWLENNTHTDFDPNTVQLDKFNSIVQKLNRRLRSNKFYLYRAISIYEKEDPVAWLQKNVSKVGTSWTWDKGAAIPYRFSSQVWEKVYIITAEVEPEDVDIFNTIALNLTIGRGDYEREIRLKDGAMIEVVSIGEFDVGRKVVRA